MVVTEITWPAKPSIYFLAFYRKLSTPGPDQWFSRVAAGPTASVSLGNLPEIKLLGLTPDLVNQKLRGWPQQSDFSQDL